MVKKKKKKKQNIQKKRKCKKRLNRNNQLIEKFSSSFKAREKKIKQREIEKKTTETHAELEREKYSKQQQANFIE